MGAPGGAPSCVADTGGREMGRRGRGRGDGPSSPRRGGGDDGSDGAGAGVAVPSGEGELEEREGTGRRGREKRDEQGATGAMTGGPHQGGGGGCNCPRARDAGGSSWAG
jgi:hypothetical protein